MSKNVFITGGSRGIGRAIVQKYQSEGFKVIAPSRQELDLASVDSIMSYLSLNQSLRVDVLVNNAAENIIKPILELSLEDWQRMVTINLTASFLLIKHFVQYMMRNNWGRIVNISSIYSIISRVGRGGYGATKSGLNSLTRTVAIEFSKNNILVNGICPGFIDTELTRQNNSPEQIESLRQQIPLKRLGNPEEVASLVFFLGSEQNTYITGHNFTIDGGFLIQ
jgi:3-oxoacyl-[acyl-carrier protein] reductase